MIITTGRVRSGRIEIDDATLPEGTKVTVLAREGEETFVLGPEDEAALLAAISEAERGRAKVPRGFFRKSAAGERSGAMARAGAPERRAGAARPYRNLL